MRVQIPEHNSFIDFPDDMPQQEIVAVLDRHFPGKDRDISEQIDATIARVQAKLGIRAKRKAAAPRVQTVTKPSY